MPQARGEVPKAHAQRLVDAVVGLKAAHVERDAAIVAALKAGGSIREVAEIVGMSHAGVLKIGHAGGWPTEAQRTARETRRQELAEWTRRVEEGIARILDADDN